MDVVKLLGSLLVMFWFFALTGFGAQEIVRILTGKKDPSVLEEAPQGRIFRVSGLVMSISGYAFLGLLTASTWGLGPERSEWFLRLMGISLASMVLCACTERKR